MLELTFLTSNITKLAHARYLCTLYDVNIIQHKLLHYGKGYDEPRLFDRDKLLEISVIDAMKRWKKHVSGLENRFYFLEDTSVVINALSNEKIEIPGVDIKYFMQETSFEELDLKLKQRGNDRKVTVLSHIMLVLTRELQDKLQKKYIVFSSKAEGQITDREYSFDTNILYPWLDNKSFNKWFVPTGYKYPISMLPIEDADNGDFRKGAFNDLCSFLQCNNKLYDKRKRNISLRLLFHPLFIITGPTCAGKTSIGKYLLEKYNYYHIEASDFMTLEYLETHGNRSGIEIGVFAKEILEVKPYVVVERVINYLNELPETPAVVITGFRTVDEIEFFNQNSPLKGKVETVFINSEYEIRYQRWLKRNRELTDHKKNKFDKINRLQIEMGLFNISKLDSTNHIVNNTSFENYYDLFNKTFLLEEISEQNMYEYKISELTPKSLEDAIILSLSEDYSLNQSVYFTTTEISHKINNTFKLLLKEKHKDNISRYFNQRFYPYYEIIENNKRLKYKLSPTGYSKAYSIIKSLKSS